MDRKGADMESAVPNKVSPLAVEPVGKLLMKFAVPSIIGMLGTALYNIVDQIFIGQYAGVPGNAATNVAFPITTICLSMILLLGVGGASNFNLAMGRGHPEKAGHMAGNAISMMVIMGISFCLIVRLFLEPLLHLFGATENVLSYALTYTGITSIGIPFLMLANGSSHLIRADGSPAYSMAIMVTGAVANTILDPIFIFKLDMGIAGAAWATVISQVLTCVLAVLYLRRFRTMKLTRELFIPRLRYVKAILTLGVASCFNQLAMALMQIVMNNTLTYYGALSQYGSEIPLACVGVVSKVNVLLIAFIVGTAQGSQPIIGFNYGAKNYDRVKETYKKAILTVTVISTIGFLCFQIFPHQIIRIFGSGDDLYYQFATKYFRIFMVLTFLNGIQPTTSNFFTSIGKANRGILLSLTRQILFLLPLVLILPAFLGIDGVMYAGPVADLAAFLLSVFLVSRELRRMDVA